MFEQKTLPRKARDSKFDVVSVHFTILGSGSAGNCAYLETAETRILIDAGLSGRQIRQRLETISRDPKDLKGILITHEHSDHISGLLGLCSKIQIPVYCTRTTRDAIEGFLQRPIDCRIFAAGSSFEIGDLQVDTFPVPHDAYDPIGFLLRTRCGNIGFVTDLGHATKLVIERIRTANVLLLETNHDVKMVQDHPTRPWSLKQRILSRHGHLSNENAADVIEQIVSTELRQIYLGHISRDCNCPKLAHQVISERLDRVGAKHIQTQVTSQTVPCPTFSLTVPSTLF